MSGNFSRIVFAGQFTKFDRIEIIVFFLFFSGDTCHDIHDVVDDVGIQWFDDIDIFDIIIAFLDLIKEILSDFKLITLCFGFDTFLKIIAVDLSFGELQDITQIGLVFFQDRIYIGRKTESAHQKADDQYQHGRTDK